MTVSISFNSITIFFLILLLSYLIFSRCLRFFHFWSQCTMTRVWTGGWASLWLFRGHLQSLLMAPVAPPRVEGSWKILGFVVFVMHHFKGNYILSLNTGLSLKLDNTKSRDNARVGDQAEPQNSWVVRYLWCIPMII